MDNKIETYPTLWSLIDLDGTDHRLKEIAVFFLNAMKDWLIQDQHKIADFDKELKEYFGSPLIIEKIHPKKFNGKNA